MVLKNGNVCTGFIKDSSTCCEEKFSKMPPSKNLQDKKLIAYAIAKIRVGVQNPDLSMALFKCVQIVQKHKYRLHGKR